MSPALRTALAVILLLGLAAAPAHARDANVTSFDGTRISTHFFPAGARGANERVPTVLIGPGYPNRGDTNPDNDTSDNIGIGTLRGAGYNVLTWDPRGIGASAGTVTFDSPSFEGRDVQALIDHVARQPEALLDAPNDPRVGMSGSSYGGGIQLITAAIEPRLDALVPDVAWHSLDTGFFKEGNVKTSWSAIVCGSGDANAISNLLGPAGVVLGRADGQIKAACLEGLGGRVSPASNQWFADRGPKSAVNAIRAPTLITHGTVDTLFPPSEAIENYTLLRNNRVPVKMMWYCGGHGTCTTPKGEEGHLRRAGVAWLDRWLKRQDVDTGAAFEWLADDGVWRSGPDYPLGDAGTLATSGANARSMGVSPLDSSQSGDGWAATPARNSISIGFPAPASGSDLVGAPTLKMTYKGNALAPATFLYAQIVDAQANRVLGTQVTPIPVTLDDRRRTVERPLEPIAIRGLSSSDYRIQITPGTSLFATQRSTGGVVVESIEATMPLVDATRSGRPDTIAALKTPKRMKVTVTSSRVNGRARVVIRTRTRTRPCTGTVTFSVRLAGRTTSHTVKVPSSCNVRRIVRLQARTGTQIRVSTRFNGNAELRPRSAGSVTHKLR